MKVKLFGSRLKDYEVNAGEWFAENKNLDVKHIALAITPSGDWIVTVIYYEDKQASGK
jgi:hypothetical protein